LVNEISIYYDARSKKHKKAVFDSVPALFVSNEFFTTSVVGSKQLQA